MFTRVHIYIYITHNMYVAQDDYIYISLHLFLDSYIYIHIHICISGVLYIYIYSYIHTYTQHVTISGSHTPKAVPWSLFAGKNTGHGGEVASLLGHRQEL